MSKKIYTAIGLMSGTSLDGIDAAMIRTDGLGHVERVGFYTAPYDPQTRAALRSCLGLRTDPDGRVAAASRAMTQAHADAVAELRRRFPGPVDLIGFHGQTVFHDPAHQFTWQIGDAAMLAAQTGVPVIYDFRSADMRAGGQGAPLIPLYHAALAHGLNKPVAILNLGGVGNVTYIGADGVPLAFDTGPANALIDDWMRQKTGAGYDSGGKTAASGAVDNAILQAYLAHPYFVKAPPKSLDRDQWTTAPVQGLSVADGAATLTAFTVGAVARALDHLPQAPLAWYVTGGGRHNKTIMQGLRDAFNVTVAPVDDLGWDGDALEAEGFAYLAVRAAQGLSLSLPTTTGVTRPMTGGRRAPGGALTAMALKAPTVQAIAEAAEILRSGGLVAMPTETVYGLAANALDGVAVAKIFAAKGRPQFNPLIVHVPDVESAAHYGVMDDRAHRVAARFWPGPLTMILPRAKDCAISDLCSAGLPTLALRVPAHPVAQDLLKKAGIPLAAPSANKSGSISPTTPMHVLESLGDAVDMILAAGPCDVGLESTVLDLSGDAPVVLRPGAVTAEDIAVVLGCDVAYDLGDHGRDVKSPGQLLKHYAPTIPVRLNAVDVAAGEALLAFGSLKFMGLRGGGFAKDLPDYALKNLSADGDLYEAAANLFRMLRDLDRPENKGIAVMNIPDQGVGIAINDRLRRAAAGSAG